MADWPALELIASRALIGSHLGELVRISHREEPSIEFRAVFQTATRELDLTTGLQVLIDGPILSFKREDLPFLPVERDVVTTRGGVYEVVGVRVEDVTWVVLRLHRRTV